MKKHSSGFVIGIVASIILGFGIIAGIVVGLQSIKGLGYAPDVLRATKTGANTATLKLQTFPDSQVCHADQPAPQINWVTYCPTTTLEVPANSVVTVEISNYDSATTLINDYFRHVHGTIDGTASVDGKSVTEVAIDAPGHTFTIQSQPEYPNPLFVSVPLTGVASNAKATENINGNPYPKPVVTTFQFKTGPAGVYVWHCYDPCGDTVYARNPPYGFGGPMSTTGWMAGTMTVTNY